MNISANTVLSIEETLRHLPVEKGDTLVVSSDIKRLLLNEYQRTGTMPEATTIIKVFQDMVGDEGTLLVPVFSWKFCKGIEFDSRKTKGEVGSLGNVAMKDPSFRRTKHPLYSFMVWGSGKKELCEMENIDGWGAGSPFDYLFRVSAKWLLLDITLDQGYTFIHHLEKVGKVPFRYNKFFTAEYVDENGDRSQKTYSMFVRNLDLDVRQNFNGIESQLLELGVEEQFMINDVSFRIIDVASSYKPILDEIVTNRCRKIYSYSGQNEGDNG